VSFPGEILNPALERKDLIWLTASSCLFIEKEGERRNVGFPGIEQFLCPPPAAIQLLIRSLSY
jgi:hypothetical protein